MNTELPLKLSCHKLFNTSRDLHFSLFHHLSTQQSICVLLVQLGYEGRESCSHMLPVTWKPDGVLTCYDFTLVTLIYNWYVHQAVTRKSSRALLWNYEWEIISYIDHFVTGPGTKTLLEQCSFSFNMVGWAVFKKKKEQKHYYTVSHAFSWDWHCYT